MAYAYSRKGKRLTLKKKTVFAIAQQPPLGEVFFVQLREMAQRDVLFTVPRQLLLAALPHKNSGKAWSLFLEVCRIAIASHPACSPLAGSFASVSADDVACDDMITEAAQYRLLPVEDPLTKKPMSKSQMSVLHHNLVTTIALWTVAVRSFTTNNAVRALFTRVWRDEAKRLTSSSDVWRRLVELRDPAIPGIVGAVFVDEASRQQQRAAEAATQLVAEQRRSEQLTAELAASKAALLSAQTSIAQLREHQAKATLDHETELSHQRDDFERLRTRVLRRLTRELDLLDEGMGAIRRDPPKLHVMLDHGERATAGLREEIRALEGEAPR